MAFTRVRARYGLALLAGMAILLIAACAPQAAAPAGGPPTLAPVGQPAKDTPKRGGVYTGEMALTTGTGVDTDPHMNPCCAPYWPYLGRAVLNIHPHDLAIMPAVAERWEISPDGKVYTLFLRKGVKFHNLPPVNGREMTADDVVFTLLRVIGRLNPDKRVTEFPRFSTLPGLKTAEAVDKYTVKLTFEKPDAGILFGLADNRNAIAAKEVVEQYGNLRNPKALISVGPYMLTEFEPDVKAVLKRHPDYYDAPKPYIDEIRLSPMPDKSTRIAAFRTGQLPEVGGLFPRDVEDIRKTDPNARFHKVITSCCGNLGIRFNLSRSPMNDIRVRKAFHLALDREFIGNSMFGPNSYGEYWVYGSPVTPMYKGSALDQDELKTMPGFRKPKDQDFAEARRLLKEAGYEKGLTLKMMHASDRAGGANGYAEVALIIQQQFARDFPEIKIEPDGILWAEQNRRNVERNYDISWWGFVYETEPGIQLHNAYHSEGGRNYTGWADAKFDSLWEQQQRTTDVETRKKLLKELQRYVLDQYTIVQGYEYFVAYLIHPWLKGYEEWVGSGNGPGGTLRYIENMWIDK